MDEENNTYQPNPESQLPVSPHPSEPPKPPNKRRNLFWPILIGVIIGTVIGIVVVPIVNDFLATEPEEDEVAVEESTEDDKQTEIDEQTDLPTQLNVSVSTQVTDIVDQVSASVVGVTNLQNYSDFWSQDENSEAGTGSGVIYKVDGDDAFIVTNHHVIEGADDIEIVLNDETTVSATLLGSDVFTDLAVLRVDATAVGKAITIGTSESLKVGEPAIAIGNPLGHMFSGTVTVGVISGTQRTIPVDINFDGRPDWQADVIQTDAAINPGNSGGALINIEGHLIGINSMKINQAAVEGIGFAIPIDQALPIVDELEKTGEVTRPFIGIEIYSLEDVPRSEWQRSLNLPAGVESGVYIWSVEPLSPADQSGLKRLDVIVEIEGIEINDTISLRKVLYEESEIGDEVKIVYYRDGEIEETNLILGVQ